jgi:hypothetical protein
MPDSQCWYSRRPACGERGIGVNLRIITVLVVFGAVLGACSSGDGAATTSSTVAATSSTTSTAAVTTTTIAETTTTVADTTTTVPKPPPIEVQAFDYRFAEVPESAPVGTELSLFNNSSAEFHEIVIFKLHDSEQRSVEELSKLPFDQLYSFDVGVLQSVVFAMPESAQYTNVEGPPVLAEEGRYLIFCAINVGMDPIDARNATARGPVDPIEGVPRHYEVGMMTEVTATG